MHSNTILTSSLLDIIFDNRNKQYGAYVLRKDYNKRLFISFIIMLAIVSVFAAWQILSKIPVTVIRTMQITGTDLSPLRQFKQPKVENIIHPQVKSSRAAGEKPVIVKDFKAKNPLLITLYLPLM